MVNFTAPFRSSNHNSSKTTRDDSSVNKTQKRPDHFRPTPFLPPLNLIDPPDTPPRQETSTTRRHSAQFPRNRDNRPATAEPPQPSHFPYDRFSRPGPLSSTTSIDRHTQGFRARIDSDADIASDLDYPVPSLAQYLAQGSHSRSSSSSFIALDKSMPGQPPEVPPKPTRSLSQISSSRKPAPSTHSTPADPQPIRPVSGIMRPSPLNPTMTPDTGYETGSSAPPTTGTYPRRRRTRHHRPFDPDILEEDSEVGEASDHLGGLPRESSAGELYRYNQSTSTLGGRKADKMLGIEGSSKLATFYLVSGACQNDPAKWLPADNDTLTGVQPMQDALNFRWRPEMHANAFSSSESERFERAFANGKSLGGSRWADFMAPITPDTRVFIPDAGPDAAWKIVSKSLKHAHPKDIEIVNSSLAPPMTHHTFKFSIPRHDSLATSARTRLTSSLSTPSSQILSGFEENTTSIIPSAGTRDNTRNLTTSTELTFHGVTLTIWLHSDKHKIGQLKNLRSQIEKGKAGFDPVIEAPVVPPLEDGSTRGKGRGRGRKGLPFFGLRSDAGSDIGSETEGNMTDSDVDGPLGRRTRGNGSTNHNHMSGDLEGPVVFEQVGDVFWMPYCITLVSRHPIYDMMIDFLRAAWSKYGKNAKAHMYQISKLLNMDSPRPGSLYRLHISLIKQDNDDLTFEGIFPGALDFDKGLVKVDFQQWPLFQALDIDNILTAIEIALSNSGRVIFCSQFSSMLGIAVNTLRYIVELRGWEGVCIPMIHARDTSFIIEDPGPYIIGLPTECRYATPPPVEVLIVDLDSNSIACKSPPVGVITPRQRREKSRQKILAALGPDYPMDRNIPMEFKCSFPSGRLRSHNKVMYKQRPANLGERLGVPKWWRQAEVLAVFDKIMLDKHKKPSFMQRLTKSGMNRSQGQLSLGEQMAKNMMRKRALHYVETRDDLEHKVARINERLLLLLREGEKYRLKFEAFEKHATNLTTQAAILRAQADESSERAKRMSMLANEHSNQNKDLEDKLKKTEVARAEAMRQLSDMHQSIQELEREREEIMNVIEAQITSAIDGGQPLGTSRPETPGGNDTFVPRHPHRTSRPPTAGSAQIASSTFTVETNPMSVLGMARRRKSRDGAASLGLGEMDRAFTERSDGIAARILSIQAKLEMALNTMTINTEELELMKNGDKVQEEDTNNQNNDGDKDAAQRPATPQNAADEIGLADPHGTPTTRERLSAVSRHRLSLQPPATPKSVEEDEFLSADEATPLKAPAPVKSAPEARNDLSLIPPGKPRLRPKRRSMEPNEGVPVRSVAVPVSSIPMEKSNSQNTVTGESTSSKISDIAPSESGLSVPSLIGHTKGPSDSTQSDLLISPSGTTRSMDTATLGGDAADVESSPSSSSSDDGNLSHESLEKQSLKHLGAGDVPGKKDAKKRYSGVSATSITFG